MEPTSTDLEPGALLAGRYRVLRRLGAGGMGEVHVVRHELTHHERALKTLHPSARLKPEVVERFLREASAAGRIGDPHIVETFDAGFLDSGAPYLVMELLVGATLAEVLHRKGRLQPADACRLVVETCEALQAAHDKGIVHRDLKPENLFLVEREGRPFVKVLDFGISKFDAALTGTPSMTTEGVAMGTPLYMAPEQMRGDEAIDARADVYALAVVLYECLAGAPPYTGKSFGELAARVLAGGCAPLDAVIPTIPAGLSDAVARGLALEPSNRVESARAFAALLRPFCDAAPASGAWWRLDAADPALDQTVEDASAAPSVGGGALPRRRDTASSEKAVERTSPEARARWATPGRMGAALVVLAGLVYWQATPPAQRAPTPASSSTATASARPEATKASPQRGGTLRVGLAGGRGAFDYFADVPSVSSVTIDLVADRLFQRTDDGSVLPGVVDRWQVLEGGRVVELHLREGLRFHPHPCLREPDGRPATTADLASSLEISAREGALPDLLQRTSVLDGQLVRVELSKPVAFPQQLLWNVPLLPAELAGCQNVRAMERPVGTGPFRLSEAPKGDVIRIVRWDHSWEREGAERLPWLDAIELRPIEDTLDAVRMVASGELDLFEGGDSRSDPVVEIVDGVPRLRASFAKAEVSVVAHVPRDLTMVLGVVFLRCPWRRPELEPVRRAMAAALDPSELARASGDAVRPLGRFLEPRIDGYDPTLVGVGKRPDEARRLLTEAGHPKGAGLDELTLGAGPESRPVAEAIRESLAVIGVKVRVVEVGGATLPSSIRNLRVDAMLTDVAIRTFGGELAFPMLIATFNRLGPPDPELTKLLDAFLAASERGERAKLATQLERRLLELAPTIPIGTISSTQSPSFSLAGPRVRGFADALTGRALPVTGPAFLRVHVAEAAP